MRIRFAGLSKPQSYHLLTHSIVPRPIAWALSENPDGSFNLAPFSYFQLISSTPATVMLSIGNRRDGTKKDTALNIERTGRFVIHLANMSLVAAVNLSSKAIPHGESEVDLCGLSTETVEGWPLPRIVGAPIAFSCELLKMDTIAGMNVTYANLIEGWFDQEILAPAPMGDVPDLPVREKLDPLAKLGFTGYAGLGQIIDLPRPE